MKTIKHLLLVNMLCLVYSFSALAVGMGAQAVKSCVALSETLISAHEEGQVLALERIPKKLLVASTVDYFVQSVSNNSMQLWAQHSFRKARSVFKCYSGNSEDSLSFLASAPALVDQTVEQKTGNSFWQFHLSIDKNKLGIWNQKTRLFPNSKSWVEQLSKVGYQQTWKSMSNGQYKLTLTRQQNSYVQSIVIYYDLVNGD